MDKGTDSLAYLSARTRRTVFTHVRPYPRHIVRAAATRDSDLPSRRAWQPAFPFGFGISRMRDASQCSTVEVEHVMHIIQHTANSSLGWRAAAVAARPTDFEFCASTFFLFLIENY